MVQFRRLCYHRVLTLNLIELIAGARQDHAQLYLDIYRHQIANDGSSANEARGMLAVIAEKSGDVETVLEVLKPISNELPTPDLKRVYGQALVDIGDYESAIPYLESFISTKVEEWQKISSNSDTLYQKAYEQEFKRLEEGQAPNTWYTRYDKASEADQGIMVDDYLTKAIELNGSYQRAVRELESVANVPPSLMTLGLAYLRTGQMAYTPKDRDSLLGKAEETFLKLQSVASDSTEYQFFLGQVYYWLNKPSKGKELFDALLESAPKDGGLRYTLAQTLREVGETTSARNLVEEAYELSDDKDIRDNSASLRAIMADSVEDKIEWLEKTDLDLINNKVALISAKADLASINGDREKAVELYRESLQTAPVKPNDATDLNNRALVHSSLYRLTGDLNELNRSVEYLDKAYQIEPNNSIVSSNTASALYNAAMREILLEKHSPNFVQLFGSDNYLRSLYDDEQSRSEVMAKLNANRNFNKALTLYQKTVALAPQGLEAYNQLFSAYVILSDERNLAALIDQLKRAKLDNAEREEEWLEPITEETKSEFIESLNTYRKNFAELREQLQADHEKALIDASILQTQIGSFAYQLPDHLKQRREELEVALKASPCAHLRSAIASALSLEAYLAAKKQSPEFAEWAASSEHYLTTNQLLLLAIHSPHTFSELIHDLPEVRHWAIFSMDYNDRFPETRDIEEWAMTVSFAQDKAPSIATIIRNSTREKLSSEYVQTIAPYALSITINKFWQLKMDGKNQEAQDFLAEATSETDRLPKF